ncbi:MAG TPA: hypothetical protein PK263_04790, partial [bacterium]|nr:hypothetical protein [bacterium]
ANANFDKKLYKSLLAYYYAAKHAEFHQCIVQKGNLTPEQATATGFTQEVLNKEISLLNAWADENAGYVERSNEISEDSGETCRLIDPSVTEDMNIIEKATFNMTAKPFEWAMCKVVTLIQSFSLALFETGFCYLAQGLESDKPEVKSRDCSKCSAEPKSPACKGAAL